MTLTREQQSKRIRNAVSNPVNNPRRIFRVNAATGKRIYVGMKPLTGHGTMRAQSPVRRHVPVSVVHPMLSQVRFERACRYTEADHAEAIDRRGFLYAIAHPDYWGWVKVGRAKDPEKRVAQANTWCPGRNFKLLGMIWFDDVIDAEREAHARLAIPFNRGVGEWFFVGSEAYRAASSGVFKILNQVKENADNV